MLSILRCFKNAGVAMLNPSRPGTNIPIPQYKKVSLSETIYPSDRPYGSQISPVRRHALSFRCPVCTSQVAGGLVVFTR
jgi:hypothetical protein